MACSEEADPATKWVSILHSPFSARQLSWRFGQVPRKSAQKFRRRLRFPSLARFALRFTVNPDHILQLGVSERVGIGRRINAALRAPSGARCRSAKRHGRIGRSTTERRTGASHRSASIENCWHDVVEAFFKNRIRNSIGNWRAQSQAEKVGCSTHS